MGVLRLTRTALAVVLGGALTLLFLDFSGTIHTYFGWMAKIQFLPALLAVNVVVVAALILVTLLLGRIYCSVVCPLGIFQDVVSRISRRVIKRRQSYSPEKKWWRYSVLALFVAAIAAGLGSVMALLDPYGIFGRMAAQLLSPIYLWSNNFLAYMAERTDSYLFYHVDVWLTGLGTLLVAVVSALLIGYLAWRNGRTYCNTICPVGTVLGVVSRFSLFKHRFNTETCNSCGLCARDCKASCIDSKNKVIDYSRCVTCFNCIDVCNKNAMRYGLPIKKKPVEDASESQVDMGRRGMLTVSAALIATATIKAQEMKMDGGLAVIEDKQVPPRQMHIVPPGAQSIRNFSQKCVGCQLCVTQCPNQVLRPSTDLLRLMQPEMSFERGYCRPECTRCSDVCPSGAIERIDTAQKSATQIGHAVWIEKNCVVLADGVFCDNCARHCPVGAIQMVAREAGVADSPKTPVVDTERCIGCGACENLCPARPFSAIYVEGHCMHRIV
ncbi:4Fe-4S binding protein [Breznakibacter xylanolyticus]|uniref:4Fe-4S binding protein n=1 Tax=Breznakibacter xylanolyticus TaxID=990 RepID=A0A2W7NQ84_9BACT|nr:4Fe-4S binding protein [Breznakibacter xylanolyticus]PZX20277.1 4Fe-4S binding protein [Breznakibacter xylanolyticus]